MQGVATIAAIAAAGFWFIKQGSLKPLVKLEQTVTQRRVANDPHSYLIAVDVRATNVGKVHVSLHEGKIFLKQLNPLPGEDLKEETLKDLELDPNEGDQSLFRTFLVPDYIRTVQISTAYLVPNDSRYTWELISAVDLGSDKPERSSDSVPNR